MTSFEADFSKRVASERLRAEQEVQYAATRNHERASFSTQVMTVARKLGPLAASHLNEYDHLVESITIKPLIPGMWAKNRDAIVATGWTVAAVNEYQYQEPAVRNVNSSAGYKNKGVLLTPSGSLIEFSGYSSSTYVVGSPNGRMTCANNHEITNGTGSGFNTEEVYEGMIAFAARTNLPTN